MKPLSPPGPIEGVVDVCRRSRNEDNIFSCPVMQRCGVAVEIHEMNGTRYLGLVDPVARRGRHAVDACHGVASPERRQMLS